MQVYEPSIMPYIYGFATGLVPAFVFLMFLVVSDAFRSIEE